MNPTHTGRSTRIHLSGDSNEYLYLNVLLIFCSQIFGILALWHDRTSRLLECGKRRCHHALANVICSRHQVINLYDYEMKYWRLLISTLTRKLRINFKKINLHTCSCININLPTNIFFLCSSIIFGILSDRFNRRKPIVIVAGMSLR